MAVTDKPQLYLSPAEEDPGASALDREVEFQALQSDRDVLIQQLQGLKAENEGLRAARSRDADDAMGRLARMEAQVQAMFAELANKERQLAVERGTLDRFRQIEQQ
eukprot:scaffold582156_cov41-Prasinocladus_malaysianus.AAC.1